VHDAPLLVARAGTYPRVFHAGCEKTKEGDIKQVAKKTVRGSEERSNGCSENVAEFPQINQKSQGSMTEAIPNDTRCAVSITEKSPPRNRKVIFRRGVFGEPALT
jgi:hypothetical protein